MKQVNETLLVSVSLNTDTNTGVLIVGIQNRKKGAVDIVNAFQDEEAMALYTKLTTKVEKKD